MQQQNTDQQEPPKDGHQNEAKNTPLINTWIKKKQDEEAMAAAEQHQRQQTES